jgi:hypothetical protein
MRDTHGTMDQLTLTIAVVAFASCAAASGSRPSLRCLPAPHGHSSVDNSTEPNGSITGAYALTLSLWLLAGDGYHQPLQ